MLKRFRNNLWKKILIMNCAFILAVIVLFTAIRYQTSIKTEQKNVQDLLTQIAESNSRQFEQMMDNISKLSLNLASSDITHRILKQAGNHDEDSNFFDLYRNQRRELIQYMQELSGTYMKDTSVNIVSAQGDYVLLDLYDSVMMNRSEIMERSRMYRFSDNSVYKFIEFPESDPYERTDTPMFSYVRKISDEFDCYGYVEIQKSLSALDAFFQNNTDRLGIITILLKEGSLFYSSEELSESLFNTDSFPSIQEDSIQKISLDRDSWLIYAMPEDQHGFRIYTMMPESYYSLRIRQEIRILLIQSIFLLLSMMVFIALFSWLIYRPVRELKVRMEHLQLDNPDLSIPDSRGVDEIETFHQVFSQMMSRILEQNDQLLQQKVHELEISYNALQAQVSPHFLYNTLSIIGLKGEEHGAPEVLDMCSYLTRMMAYCINSQQDQVMLSDEIEYTENYLQLMKFRYLEKLQYQIIIGEHTRELPVPRFILQPLVENCFTHGFKNCDADRFIVHVNIQRAPENWSIVIEDNGAGFSNEDVDKINDAKNYVHQSLKNPNAKFVKGITSIGLVNTYARLYIAYSGNITLTVGKSSLGGGLVQIICGTLPQNIDH